jgi:predicted aspartyl protease
MAWKRRFRLGLPFVFAGRPPRGDYNATVTTANGTIKAARTRLAMADIGGFVVRDVDAMMKQSREPTRLSGPS